MHLARSTLESAMDSFSSSSTDNREKGCRSSWFAAHLDEANSTFVGPLLNLDYAYVLSCWSIFGLLVLIAWLATLMLFMKSTADLYLSGTLGVICAELRLSHEVAGSTFLAFGNGAPDVFSSLAAFTHDSSPATSGGDLGLGSILGGASFVTTIVLGLVIFASKDPEGISVRREAFGRDTCFLVAGLLWLLIVASTPIGANIFTSVVFLLMYIAYAAVVVKQAREFGTGDGGRISPSSVSQVSHYEDLEDKRGLLEELEGQEDGANASRLPAKTAMRLAQSSKDNPFAADVGTAASAPKNVPHLKRKQQQRVEANEVEDDEEQNDDENDAILRKFQIAGKARDEHVQTVDNRRDRDPNLIIEDHFGAPSTSTITTVHPPPPSQSPTLPLAPHSNALLSRISNQLYWKRLRFSRRYSKEIAAKLAESTDASSSLLTRVFSVVSLPLELLRTLTVPPPEASAWSKSLAVIYPPLCTVFFFYAVGIPILRDPVVAIASCSSLILSLLAYFCLHDTKPPESSLGRLVLSLISFLMSVLWIELAAGEIVAVVDALGSLVGANSSIMGLSLLAWGNSVGDLVSNVAVVRSGFPQMAVSACVSGPVFNLLVGLGVSLTVLSAHSFPHSVDALRFDRYSSTAVILLLIVLTTQLAWLTFLYSPRAERWRLTRCLGIVLIVSYVIYSIAVVLLVVI